MYYVHLTDKNSFSREKSRSLSQKKTARSFSSSSPTFFLFIRPFFGLFCFPSSFLCKNAHTPQGLFTSQTSLLGFVKSKEKKQKQKQNNEFAVLQTPGLCRKEQYTYGRVRLPNLSRKTTSQHPSRAML